MCLFANKKALWFVVDARGEDLQDRDVPLTRMFYENEHSLLDSHGGHGGRMAVYLSGKGRNFDGDAAASAGSGQFDIRGHTRLGALGFERQERFRPQGQRW